MQLQDTGEVIIVDVLLPMEISLNQIVFYVNTNAKATL